MNTRIFRFEAFEWAGAAVTAAAVILLGLAYRDMGSSWRIGVDAQTPGPLITTGLFGKTRNPIYLAINCYMAGSFLLNSTPVGLLYAVMTPVFLHWQILREERALWKVYGESFGTYRGETPRYLWL